MSGLGVLAALSMALLLNDGQEYKSEKLLRISFLKYKVFILFTLLPAPMIKSSFGLLDMPILNIINTFLPSSLK